MIRSFARTALRFFARQKGFTLLNVLGLAIGLTCSFFIVLWVQHEVRYDTFHDDGDRIHRVMRNYYPSDGKVFTWTAVPMPLAEVLRTDYPAVSDVVAMSWEQEFLLTHGERAFRLDGRYAGPELFQIFSFPFLEGDPETALQAPDAIVLSEASAVRLFGPDWKAEGIVGRSVTVDDDRTFTVRGVFAPIPETSTLQFEHVLALESYVEQNDWLHHWGNSALRMFVRLEEEADPDAVTASIESVINDHHEIAHTKLFLQPLLEARLYSNFENGEQDGGRIEYVRMFSIVALLILLIASINFMNLATARSSQRAREIGVRKALGATRNALAGQFVAESVLLAVVAFLLAVGAVGLGLTAFNDLTGKSIDLGMALSASNLGLFGAIALGTGLLAGSYPALYLSAFPVARVLRGQTGATSGAVGLRQGLVVFQFAMSILLIVGTLTVYRQIDYIQSKNLGLDTENLIMLRKEGGVDGQYDTFRRVLLNEPGVASVGIANQNPLAIGNSTTDPTWPNKDPDSQILFSVINTGYDFVKTMRMDVIQGRAFSREYGADSTNYVVNETAVRAMGLDEPLGTELSFWDQTGQIVGVVKDFHMTSLYEPIEPTILRLDPQETRLLFVRTEPGGVETGLESLKETVATFNPGYPFTYEFLDAVFAETYESEQVIGSLARLFTLLALVIACLGLYGLAAYAAEQRTREIGIRKTLGASVSSVVMLLSSDFVKLVAVAFAVAVPFAYLAAEHWLSSFAYRIDVNVDLYVLAGIGALLVAGVTVSIQSIRAALLDPVRALRRE